MNSDDTGPSLFDDERVMITILRAGELYKKESNSLFKNHGITFAQYNVLRILEASENGKNTMRNVTKVMLVSGAYVTGIARKLEDAGLLVRQNDPKDGRVKYLQITAKGREILEYIAEQKNNNIRKFFMGCSDYQKRQLLSNLRKIVKNGFSV